MKKKEKKRYNIVFSSTRQWNPGDEIILRGIINLFSKMGIGFNPLLFNRNPDVRGYYGNAIYKYKASFEDWMILKPAIMDNSIKPWMDYSCVDAIVIAGTPEWQGWRNHELYVKAVEYRIPVFLIGIDGEYGEGDFLIDCVLRNAKIISVRNQSVLNSFLDIGLSPAYLTCPSVFSSNIEKKVRNIKTIGLIYRGKSDDVSYGNGWDGEEYDNQIQLYKRLVRKYKSEYKIIVICHYIDELCGAKEDFPEEDILYSYASEDYFGIYKECDLVIGSRIHGIGLASSLCIPSVPIKYDFRQGTLDSFMIEPRIYNSLSVEELVEYSIKNAGKISRGLLKKKKDDYEKYRSAFKDKLSFGKVNYNYHVHIIDKDKAYCHDRRMRFLDNKVYYELMNCYVRDVLNYLNCLVNGKRILIKGAGGHTNKLLSYLDADVQIVAIIDNNIRKFDNYPVIKNEEIIKMKFDYIVISSMKYEREMIREMNELGYGDKVISLYRILEDNYLWANNDFFRFIE